MKTRTPLLIAGISVFVLVALVLITPALAGTIPTISIVSVKPDDNVTIKTHNYPANTEFEVRMGKFGTRGINGILVDTVNSGSGGSFEDTFTIPQELNGQARIAIRLESKSGYYYSYNWFYNSTTGGGGSGSGTATPTASAPTATPTATTTPPATTTGTPSSNIPTISIVSVVPDDKVNIKTHNYPANTNFNVRMGKFGTQAVNGILVDTINSGSGGSFEDTFDIPTELYNENRIAIRLESNAGYFSYNWFYNR